MVIQYLPDFIASYFRPSRRSKPTVTEPCPFRDSENPTIRDPAFLGNLMRPLQPWDLIIIEGKSPNNANRIDISFETSKAPSDKIPFLFSVRFQEGIVYRNTKVDGKWGTAESMDNLQNRNVRQPLKRGKRFVVTFFMTENDFLISINKNAFCTYGYRMKLRSIRTIRVHRDVYKITRVDHRSFYPTPWPKYLTPAMMSFDAPEALLPGWVIVFGGVIFVKDKSSFDVRLFEMGSQRIRLLMRFEDDQISYYENSTGKGYNLSLSHEVIQHRNPLRHMQPFKVAIAIASKEFRVAINGEIQRSYPYFSPISALSGLKFLEQGAKIMIYSVDYVRMDDEQCRGFAVLSKLNFRLT